MTITRVAVITTPRSGWASIRARWERHLPEAAPGDLEFRFFHLEDYAKVTAALARATGRCESVWCAAAGRAAAQAALADGCQVILLATAHFAPLLPRRRDVRYLLYADATPDQLARLYGGGEMARLPRRLFRRLGLLAQDGHRFLCMSSWCAGDFRDAYGVPAAQLTVLPPFVDVDYWRPAARPAPTGALRLAFVGADGRRKGLDIALAVAAMPEFSACRLDIVTGEPGVGDDRIRYHPRFKPDSDGLRDLIAGADLLVLPTRADCSPLVVLEAGACAVPSLATAVGGVADEITDGVDGSLLPAATPAALAAALRPYVERPMLARERGEAMRRRVIERFSRQAHLAILIGEMAAAARSAGG